MSSTDRSPSRDRTALTKQTHSAVDGRAAVPMWDSSDPERAPPPLPLPPGSQSPTTRANTSSAIAAAAQQIIERARESTPISSYTSNVAPLSPDRSLVKGTHHKRMQSLQTSSVKDLRSYIDNNRSPERAPERPASSNSFIMYGKDSSKDYGGSHERSPTPTPSGKDLLKDTPSLRPTTRAAPRPILGENTPPSSTMLALQTMKVPDDAFIDLNMRPATPSTPRPSTTYDFSSQLLNLTSIATSLQKEMAAISRRSKDNATDLLSLKEATLARDEDIRKSLKDLSTNVSSNLAPGNMSRNASSLGGLFLDNKAFSSPPPAAKPYTIPRVSSVPNFADIEHVGSPSPYSVEGAASVAMLEKIIREMVTKEGQERLLGTLSELFEKSSKDNSQAAKKVEELADFIKEKSASSALVPITQTATGAPRLDLSFDSPSATRGRAVTPPASTSVANDEVFRLLQKIKDSIGHSGGATAEVKGLVRDMRGEVLGMGRELGRKLDQVADSQVHSSLDRSITDTSGAHEETHRILQEGLDEIRSHLAEALHQHSSRIDEASRQITVAQPALNGDQIYSVVKHALVEHEETSRSLEERPAPVDHEGVLEAVKEGLKDFEPNIELQQFGLERDEILAVLKEGLEDYQRSRPEPAPIGIDKGEIYEMMQEALKDFQPGQKIRDDILADVRAALADFHGASQSTFTDEATRVAIIEAVRETVAEHGPAAPRELEISRDDLCDAVQASFDSTSGPFSTFSEKVSQRLQDLVDGLQGEFKQYSAANGRDTEQVLDAVKDGLEALRTEIESYVDRAQDVTGKDEIIDTVKAGLEQLRVDIQEQQRSTNDTTAGALLDYIKAEFEQLHEANGRSRELHEPTSDRSLDLLQALQMSVDDLKSRSRSRSISSESESKEEVYEAMKEEFEQLKTAILHGHAADKGELIETIQDSLGALHSRFNGSELSSMSSQSTEEILSNIRQEFTELKTSLTSTMDEGDRDVIITGVKRSIDDLRVQLAADHSDASAETMGMMKEELERFREMMSTSVVLGGNGGQHEALVAIREGLEELREIVNTSSGTKALPEDLLEALHGEFEILRNSVGTQSGSNEEVLDTIRVGLDDLQSSLEKKLDSRERNNAQQSELLDAMGEGLETLRADVLKTLDKPLDMTVNYEILDALKEGFASLRSELDGIKPVAAKSGQIVLAEGGIIGEASRDIGVDGAEPAAATSAAKQLGLDKIEILLAQLQIKIEGLAASIHDGSMGGRSMEPENAATRADLEGIEIQLKDLQETVLTIAEREHASTAPEGAATKADTDAIETLLRNAKSHLEDTLPQEAGSLATKEHFETLESMTSLTAEVLDSLKEKIDDTVACKADVAVVEVLVQDMKTMLDEMKEKSSDESTEDSRLTKADFDVLGILCTEIKTKLTEMDAVASKADVEQLHGLILEFRKSHEKLRESYESDIAITAKAFDDRKQEFESTIAQIDEVKLAVMEAKDDLLQRLTHEDVGLEIIVDKLKSLEDKAFSGAMSLEVTEILEVVKAEFERTHSSVEALKVDHEHNATTALEKQGEHKEALVLELGERLDTLFDGLMSKYDDAQLAAAEQAKALEEKSNSHEALFLSTKDMADDLRLSIDTLGTSLTSFTATYPDSMDKLVSDSKIVFNRVDDTYNKLDEAQSGLQHEHTVTRSEVQKVMTTLQALHSDLSEHNPRFMMSLREVQALITQHYEHSQKASEAAEQNTQAVRDLQQALKTGFEDAKGHTSSQTEVVRGALPALLPAPSDATSIDRAPYDDSGVHEKLDSLMDHVRDANSSAPQLERLDQIHEKVMATAAEVSAFVALQSRQIEQSSSTDTAVALERQSAQRDQIEADIAVLDEEKEDLQAEVDALKHERDALLAQKMKAATELSSVQTALAIRREELHHMENKAEMIERRMLEGVMNQSRLLLLTKSTRSQSPSKRKPQGRDLRIASNTSSISAMTTSTMPPLHANHTLAMKTRQPLSKGNQTPNTAERRIMSLSQIDHNLPSGGNAYATTPTLVDGSANGLKRSHSVKTGFNRKTSWAGTGKTRRVSEFNKENEALSEEDEEDDDFHSVTHRDDDDGEELDSEAGTERRTSYATESGIDHDQRPSLAGSEMSYETGSYLEGSEMDHRDSLAGSEANVDNNAEQEATKHVLRLEAPPTLKHVYAPPSDSGIGSDLPTALLSPSEQGVFFK
ncbi:hypothetical protein AMS68_001779 [Peltaster fructicola]|uniref:Uncharacterized protein n=1 Tax=Peltaster fructicola TaxID=286661 RepID=A0A6H0XNC9_9PEZI|nr:hypothetical protein AMS68_001779 [Peltaster fructicola]